MLHPRWMMPFPMMHTLLLSRRVYIPISTLVMSCSDKTSFRHMDNIKLDRNLVHSKHNLYHKANLLHWVSTQGLDTTPVHPNH